MIGAVLGRIVEAARRPAGLVAVLALLLTIASGFYAATHLSIDTDIDNMLPTDLPWRQNDRALDKAFPQNANLLVVVIDARTGDIAENAAHELAKRMQAKPELFAYVRRPDGG